MAEDNKIIFRMGEETGFVIEKTKEQFDHSLFREQYKQAFVVINDIIARTTNSRQKDEIEKNISNVIAFCGDRGEGKTSALVSVRGVLQDNDIFKAARESQLLEGIDNIKENTFKVLKLIDPAFFDDKHNLIELLLGQMYADIRKDDDVKAANNHDYLPERINGDIAKRNALMQLFQEVRQSLSIINKPSNKNAYDDLEEVDELAAGIELKEKLYKLMHCYAQYFAKERVLICIDDLDLNVTEGYKMCEEIRKYLSSPDVCLVMMAIKVDQLVEVVQSYLRNNIHNIVLDGTITEMSERYVAKLLPQSNRIYMLSDDLFNGRNLIVKEAEKDDQEFSTVQEAIVRLIFRKTRYIFVNGRNISPIVPKNLRDLRLLMATLWQLRDCGKNDEQHIKNKAIFKQYFYHTWTKNLERKDREFIESFVESPDPISINKTIVAYLAARYANYIKTADKKIDERANASLINAILNPQNTKQNVSMGDTLLLINIIENLTEDIDTKNLLFFIKAFYSITLYEAYDVATIDKQHLYALTDDSQVSIYKYDSLYRKINALQRVLNGAYFSYCPEDVITKESQTLTARDIRFINPQPLKGIYNELISKPKENIQDYELKLNTLEFFALTTTYDAYSGDEQKESYRRSLTIPLYLRPIRPKASLLTFDVLSIFYNIINIKHTYERWNDFYKVDDVDEQSGNLLANQKTEEEQEAEEKNLQKKPSLFDLASNSSKLSLYGKMMEICSEGSEDDEIKYAPEHYLISDAAIRFVDVQLAIMDLALNNKRVHRVKSNKLNIRLLYNDIQLLGIALYPIKEGDNQYPLTFKFLQPICTFLKNIGENDFNAIFSPASLNEGAGNDVKDLQEAIMYIASTMKFPIKGLEMRDHIKKTFNDFYKECGNAPYWNKLLDKEKNYNNLSELLTRLLTNKGLRTIFIQNIDKLLPEYKTSPLY